MILAIPHRCYAILLHLIENEKQFSPTPKVSGIAVRRSSTRRSVEKVISMRGGTEIRRSVARRNDVLLPVLRASDEACRPSKARFLAPKEFFSGLRKLRQASETSGTARELF